MNDYQLVLKDVAYRLHLREGLKEENYQGDASLVKLQELVDKEIPMKVKNIKPAGHSLYLGECPRCNTTIDYLDYPYTCCAKGCRQALDWGVTKNE